jgi:hypothetical protein
MQRMKTTISWGRKRYHLEPTPLFSGVVAPLVAFCGHLRGIWGKVTSLPVARGPTAALCALGQPKMRLLSTAT